MRGADSYDDGVRFGELSKLLPVLMVVSMIAFLYVEYVLLHGLRLLQLDMPEVVRDKAEFRRGVGELIAFHVITGLLLYCFMRCCLTLPGSIPDGQGWELRTESEEGEPSTGDMKRVSLTEKKTTGERRHCKWCLKYKPDRTHHCRICNTCVIRMDHHCPWVYNCIGFRNHKYFILLLIYTAVDLIFIVASMFESVWWSTRTDVGPAIMLNLILAEAFACFLTVITWLFLGFHFWLTIKAMTTLEFCEKSMKMASYNSSLYSRGCYQDICAVLGPNPLLWLLPCSLPTGDGLNWQQ